ncbi:MAG: HupE/UreJ family protein [Pseudomonadota bacterium]
MSLTRSGAVLVSANAFARLILLIVAISLVFNPEGFAHPEDEFCTFDGGIDPALCNALQELDRSATPRSGEGRFTATETIDFDRPLIETFSLYIKIGVQHILPTGLDHILFVLALFFTAASWRALLIQISAFTVAHTLTLMLAATEIISPPASVVEPLIALTIAFVAFENVIFKDMRRWRPLVVIVFGLIHGMGFAGFFGSLGLPQGQFWSALVGFNIGVEIGQLSVVAFAALLLWPVASKITPLSYRRLIAIPACFFIGLIGAFWTFERVFLG